MRVVRLITVGLPVLACLLSLVQLVLLGACLVPDAVSTYRRLLALNALAYGVLALYAWRDQREAAH